MLELRPLTEDDVEAHNAGEDDQIVHWLSGCPSTEGSTRRHFATLADNARRGVGKRGFGVWLDDRLAGYVDCDPSPQEGLVEGDVNISYAVHPWARGRGVATAAVHELCRWIAEQRIGRRAVLRIDVDNDASLGVARAAGFERTGEFISSSEVTDAGDPAVMAVFVHDLEGGSAPA